MSHLNSSQVSKKIRSAIKAKLVELGAYVDEELPDYIMVMLVNKKPKETLTQDLKLFLNKNTDTFVDWLLNVLEKLDKVVSSSEEKRKKKKEFELVSEEKVEEKERKSVSSKRKGSSEPKLKSKIVAILPDDSDGEYDPEKILKKSILASSIQVPERKRGVEANKNLVLKAVAEADQSIKRRRALDRLRDNVAEGPPLPSSSPNKTLQENTEVDLRDRLRKKRQQRKEEEERRQVRRRSSSHSDKEEEDEDLEKMRELVLESIKRKQESMSKESRKIVVAPDHKRRKETSISPSHSSSRSLSSSSSLTSFEELKKTQERKQKRENEDNQGYEPEISHADSMKRPFLEDRSGLGSQRRKAVNLKSNSMEKKKPEAKVAPMLPILLLVSIPLHWDEPHDRRFKYKANYVYLIRYVIILRLPLYSKQVYCRAALFKSPKMDLHNR
ncbi:ZC3H14 [Lepeophtheirus salmonis]|uniref:Zinc finger CCCH domain-containing protein 14 n=1 Tax=Lepeophtheirus salmonis TaxID=72036 RepID=A0A7R8D2N4_LEPSM|nr:ZC3H14 [Lepeophtheirus salmonis]CAF2957873.1 ZC3H14 [Lepeophtheirus salmonis]